MTIGYTENVFGDPEKLHQNVGFRELCAVCNEGYPPDITSNLDVISIRILQPPGTAPTDPGESRGFALLLRELIGARYLCEYLYLRNIFQARSKPAVDSASISSQGRVLALLAPYREDHYSLIYPVTRILEDYGVSTFILHSRRAYLPPRDDELFRGSRLVFGEDLYTAAVYRQARTLYRKLSPSINMLGRELGLTSHQQRQLHILFQTYSVDKAVFAEVLRLVQPSVVYGLHYISNPGYLAAIDAMRAHSPKPIKLLIQHGFFVSGGFHDFKGADCVLLWGDYFQAMLNSGFVVPVPEAKVMGNPKLELELGRIQGTDRYTNRMDGAAISKVIVYVSTPDMVDNYCNRKALHLFAEALRRSPADWRIMYKPHPDDNPGVYHGLIQRGLIRKDQVIAPNAPIFEVLGHADVVTGTFSTALIDAMALGVPVVQVLPELSGTDWGRYGVQGASTEEELLRVLTSILSDAEYRSGVLDRQRMLVENMFGTTIASSKKIADYIMSLL